MPFILAVDSEPAIRSLIAVALRQNGFTVRTAGKGAHAISLSRSHRGEIVLVITDIMLPDMDGPTLVKALSKDDPGVPVLFTSAQETVYDRDEFGGSVLLAKPFSIGALLAKVRALIRERDVRPAA